MENTLQFIVDDVNAGYRLDKFLSSKIPDYSRNMIQKFIADGCVLNVKNQPVYNQKLIVNIGDEFFINIPDMNKNNFVMQNYFIHVLLCLN